MQEAEPLVRQDKPSAGDAWTTPWGQDISSLHPTNYLDVWRGAKVEKKIGSPLAGSEPEAGGETIAKSGKAPPSPRHGDMEI